MGLKRSILGCERTGKGGDGPARDPDQVRGSGGPGQRPGAPAGLSVPQRILATKYLSWSIYERTGAIVATGDVPINQVCEGSSVWVKWEGLRNFYYVLAVSLAEEQLGRVSLLRQGFLVCLLSSE